MKQFEHFFNTLSLTNAIAILIAALGTIYFIWHFLLWQPIKYEKTTMTQQIQLLQFEVSNLSKQLEAAKKMKFQTTATQKELLTVNEISSILKKLIVIRQNLKLLTLQIQPEQTIPVTGSSRVFTLNNFSIKVLGTYFSTLEYLKALEKEKIPFYWDVLKYKVTDYPFGEVSINIHVLSY